MSPDLERFVGAQRTAYPAALEELRRGRKTGHWMWFIFPQVAGLGRSETSRFYAIASLDEARAYLAHPVLGTRVRECAAAMLTNEGRTAAEILGDTDALKLRSSMTLFHRAAPHDPVFAQVLLQFFEGVADPATDERLRGSLPAARNHERTEPIRGTRMPTPASVDDYLASLTDAQRVAIQALRETIAAAAPMATETIAYQMPAFRSHGGRFLVSFAAYRRHSSLFPASAAVVDALGDELTPYLAGKGTIQFPADRPIPIETVRRIIEVRVAENAAAEH